jgi:hypothetical protein
MKGNASGIIMSYMNLRIAFLLLFARSAGSEIIGYHFSPFRCTPRAITRIRAWLESLLHETSTKTLIFVRHFRALAIVILSTMAFSVRANSISEPGFIMYGAISTANGGMLQTKFNWQISSGSLTVSVNPVTINVNGQNFYIATVPFETRSIGGSSVGAATPNTLALNSMPTTYARLATVNGTNAAIVYASSGSTNIFTFGPADRGRIERVDLSVSSPLTFAQWLVQYGLPANSNPNSDPTRKGMTLMQQFIAGLNPNDPNSLFQFVGIQPVADGVQVQWSSVADITYTLQQGISLDGPFTVLQSNIIGTPATNTFSIPTPTNGSTLFLRVLINQPN